MEIIEKIKSPARMKGKNIQITKNIAPKLITRKKKITPTIIVKNLTTNPRLREIRLKAIYSKSLFKSSPLGFMVMSLFQGAKSVLINKGMEK